MSRNLEFKDVLVLAFSTMIGWGWVALTGKRAELSERCLRL